MFHTIFEFGPYVRPFNGRAKSNDFELYSRKTGYSGPLFVSTIPSAMKLSFTRTRDPLVASTWDPNMTLVEVINEYIDPGLALLQCDLHKAKYHTHYHFSAGLGSVKASINELAESPFELIELTYGFSRRRITQDCVHRHSAFLRRTSVKDCITQHLLSNPYVGLMPAF